MAASKLIVAVLIFLTLLFFGAIANAGTGDSEIVKPFAASDDALELDNLMSMISSLESSISDRTLKLKSKDESIAHLEKIVQEKSASIVLLQRELESFQKKGAVDAEQLVGKAHSRAGELEKQVEKLKSDIDIQNGKRVALEARASEAEKKLQELTLKLESIQKINDEQKHRIRKTEHVLKLAEEELMRAQREASSKMKELNEVHGAWIPPWLATHISYCQDLAATRWNKHAKPALDAFFKKGSEKSAQAQTWVEPHLEAAKSKLIPAVKKQWDVFTTHMEPHVEAVSKKTVEIYETSWSTIAPHIAKVQELADPYIQEVKIFSKPYVDQVAHVAKPHVAKIRIALKPYNKCAVRSYRKLVKSTNTYHRQVQATIMEKLKKHELTSPLANKELVWFMASALLAFPIFFLYRLLSAIFCKKAKKLIRNSHANHVSRRHKRRHADK